MREIIYYVASTLDGFIAQEDGSFEAFPFDEHYGRELLARFPETFAAPCRRHLGDTSPNQLFDTVLMGRATYEVGVRAGLTSPYPSLAQYVVSRTMRASPDPAVTLISEDAIGRIRRVQDLPGRAIWLCGGGELASSLLEAGLLSRVIVKLNPIAFGTGIPLFRRAASPVPLTLVAHQAFPSGHVLLDYRVGS